MARFLVALLACLALPVAADGLPPGSELRSVDGVAYHLRSLGPPAPAGERPAVVLLSGPSGRWHSDSGWFALLQPLLAREFRTVAIDRPAQGFGPGESRSYADFGRRLGAILAAVGEPRVVIVGFASANLALAHYLGSADAAARVAGVLLVDPDALAPSTVEFYARQAADFQNPALAQWVRDGGYDARAAAARESERAEVARLLPPGLEAVMDWGFYDAVAAARTERERIVQRFAEVGRYDSDVREAAALGWPAGPRTVVWDTDFESADIARAPEDAALRAWRADGSAWFAERFGACHRASPSTEHLAMFAEAEALAAEVRALAAGKDCAAAR